MAATLSLRALHGAFAAIQERSVANLTAGELDELRGHAHTVTRDLKADGLLPERIIIVVRRIANDTGVGPELLNRVVLWCVEHYYADDVV